MKKIIYNAKFFPNFVKSLVEDGRGTKSMIVEALNEKDDKKKTTLSQLNRWLNDESVLPTKKIVNLINHMSGVSLFDFFVNEDGTKIDRTEAKESNKDTQILTKNSSEDNVFLLRMENKHIKDIDMILQRNRDKEDEIRQEYEKRIAKRESELREIILSKESEILLLKKLLTDKEMEIMNNQVEQLKNLLTQLDTIKELPEGSEDSKLWSAEVDDLLRSLYGQYSPKYREVHNLLYFVPLATPSGEMVISLTYKDRLDKVKTIVNAIISTHQ